MADQRVIVIGGGLAGLAATMKIAELGTKVLLISFQPVKRSHSVVPRVESMVQSTSRVKAILRKFTFMTQSRAEISLPTNLFARTCVITRLL